MTRNTSSNERTTVVARYVPETPPVPVKTVVARYVASPGEARFSYGDIPPAVAERAKAAVTAFHAARKRIAAEVVEIGQALIEVKDALEHGQFTAWLDAEFGAEERTARNYMQAARHFAGKTEIIADLPITTVYKLTAPAVPDTVRAAIVSRIEAEPEARRSHVVVRMIEEGVEAEKKRRASERETARLAKLPPEERKRHANNAVARARAEERRDAARVQQDEKHHRERVEKTKREIRAARLIAAAAGPMAADLVPLLQTHRDGLGLSISRLLRGLPVELADDNCKRFGPYGEALAEIEQEEDRA